MKCSLVLATCGRVTEVGEFLASFARGTPDGCAIQLIVADQNDDGRLKPILANLPPEWEIRHVAVPEKGVCLARNHVLPMADGEIVAFPDDDCLYAPDTIEKVVSFFRKHPSIDVVLGRTIASKPWGQTPNGMGTDPKIRGDRPQRTVGTGPKRAKRLNKYSIFSHGEMYLQFYRKSAIDKIGRFDEDFGPGIRSRHPFGGDDSDYLARAVLGGLKIARDESIRVWHPPQDHVGFDARKIAGYGATRMALLRKLRYPFWFKLANVVYPLARMMLERPGKWRYRWAMFCGRLFAARRKDANDSVR